ncbi:unconventional myosin-XV-like [Melanerpes formicivorus]|uniref:unconventional myosin-XV-like n=1 Tax=Melanerpes formicivorus TaxID=211600 RepID=UPI00358EBA70
MCPGVPLCPAGGSTAGEMTLALSAWRAWTWPCAASPPWQSCTQQPPGSAQFHSPALGVAESLQPEAKTKQGPSCCLLLRSFSQALPLPQFLSPLGFIPGHPQLPAGRAPSKLGPPQGIIQSGTIPRASSKLGPPRASSKLGPPPPGHHPSWDPPGHIQAGTIPRAHPSWDHPQGTSKLGPSPGHHPSWDHPQGIIQAGTIPRAHPSWDHPQGIIQDGTIPRAHPSWDHPQGTSKLGPPQGTIQAGTIPRAHPSWDHPFPGSKVAPGLGSLSTWWSKVGEEAAAPPAHPCPLLCPRANISSPEPCSAVCSLSAFLVSHHLPTSGGLATSWAPLQPCCCCCCSEPSAPGLGLVTVRPPGGPAGICSRLWVPRAGFYLLGGLVSWCRESVGLGKTFLVLRSNPALLEATTEPQLLAWVWWL